MNKPTGYTFNFDNSRDFLDKLHRECERLEATDSLDEKTDHMINGATTSWHLYERFWREMEAFLNSDPPDVSAELGADVAEQMVLQHKDQLRKIKKLREDAAAALGIDVGSLTRKKFGKYMAKKHKEIEACRLITTEAKHARVDENGDIHVVTFVSASTSPTLGHIPVPKVGMGSTVVGSSDVLRHTHEIWKNLIYGLRID